MIAFDTEGQTFTTYEDTAEVMRPKSEGARGPSPALAAVDQGTTLQPPSAP